MVDIVRMKEYAVAEAFIAAPNALQLPIVSLVRHAVVQAVIVAQNAHQLPIVSLVKHVVEVVVVHVGHDVAAVGAGGSELGKTCFGHGFVFVDRAVAAVGTIGLYVLITDEQQWKSAGLSRIF
jgi:hypothetical protein